MTSNNYNPDDTSSTSFNGTSTGYWGPVTSTIDFCEANYDVSPYIAEFWNTISNLGFILFPLLSSWNVMRHKPTDWLVVISFWIMVFMGMGSWMFHMTLQYYMQLWDELSMSWFILHVFYVSLVVRFGDDDARVFRLPVFLYGILISMIYLVLNLPEIFQILFGACVYSTVYHTWYVGQLQKKKHHDDPKMQSLVNYFVMISGNIVMHGAFILWLIDMNLCSNVQSIRGSVWPLFRPVTQLHAWWHIGMYYAGICLIQYVYQARLLSLNQRTQAKITLMGIKLYQLKDSEVSVFVSDWSRGYSNNNYESKM